MKVKIGISAILLLLCANLVVLSFLLAEAPKDESTKPELELYQMAGTGEKWNVDHYKVIKTSNRIKRTSAKLSYKGDESEIERSDFLKFEISENDQTVYSTIHSSEGGPVSILTNLDNTGSIASELTPFDESLTKDVFETTKATITWKDSEGRTHHETIAMTIVDEQFV